MKTQKTIDLPYVIGLFLLPVLLVGLFLLTGWMVGLVRYNPAYFTDEYRKRYAVPSPLLSDLEDALRSGDGKLLAQLQGTRRIPSDLEKISNLRFLIFTDSQGEYSNFLFMDMKNYRRYIQHLRLIKGRYVRVPEGIYYLADSGSWKRTFGPLAVVYWLILIIFTLGVWIYRSMAEYRRKLFGKPPGSV